MKKIVAGIGFELTGALMVLSSFLIASMTMENTTEWNTKLGKILAKQFLIWDYFLY